MPRGADAARTRPQTATAATITSNEPELIEAPWASCGLICIINRDCGPGSTRRHRISDRTSAVSLPPRPATPQFAAPNEENARKMFLFIRCLIWVCNSWVRRTRSLLLRPLCFIGRSSLLFGRNLLLFVSHQYLRSFGFCYVLFCYF